MATESDTAPPPVDGLDTEERIAKELSAEEKPPKAVEKSADPPPSGGDLVDPLEVPLPEEWTTQELIANRKEEKGVLFACCFALCCCPLCYEKLEFILDFLCCKTCK